MPLPLNYTPEGTPLSLQEQMLAVDMFHARAGSAALDFTMRGEDRLLSQPYLDSGQLVELVGRFHDDPKEVLGIARDSLFLIAGDTRLTLDERTKRLGRYFDAYTELTLKLDHKAFPPDPIDVVHKGIPDYLADGFVDMGGEQSLGAQQRSREAIVLDKAGVFKKYRADILEILSVPKIMNANNDDRKRLIMSALAGIVYAKLPYAKDSAGKPIQNLGGGKVNLSTLDEGVCRHLAMTYQVLAQALGVSSRLFKNYESFGDGQGRYGSPEKHAANMVRVNGKWYILDATQPDWITLPNGTKQWRPGTLEIDRPPLKGQVRTYEGALKHSGRRKKYISNPESFYRIDKIS